MGDLGFEQQEAVISANYVSDSSQANAVELAITVNSTEGVIEALNAAGIKDYTFDTTNKVIKILGFDLNNTTELKEQLAKLKKELGDNYGQHETNTVSSRYIDRGDRQNLYDKWRKSRKEGKQNRKLHTYITQAQESLEQYFQQQ